MVVDKRDVETLMLDVLFISLTLAFFALCFGYVAWCDRLMK